MAGAPPLRSLERARKRTTPILSLSLSLSRSSSSSSSALSSLAPLVSFETRVCLLGAFFPLEVARVGGGPARDVVKSVSLVRVAELLPLVGREREARVGQRAARVEEGHVERDRAQELWLEVRRAAAREAARRAAPEREPVESLREKAQSARHVLRRPALSRGAARGLVPQRACALRDGVAICVSNF